MDGPLTLLRKAIAPLYAIDREIGRGGMATVFLAHDLRYDRNVAIKILRPEVGAAIGADRFRLEIQVLARLTHPGILPVLDSGETTTADGIGHLWYTMPFIAGESLRERLKREGQLPVEVVTSIAREVAGALDYAHRNGIVHRDVKPENILLEGDRAKLADFGVAQVLDHRLGERLTAAGITLGTPSYMSPEQAMAEPEIDGRSDVYSLGCVLYEALTGEPPFTGRTPQAIIARMMSDEPRLITTVRPDAAALQPVVLKALARAPADRFATAADMVVALRAPRTIDEVITALDLIIARARVESSRLGYFAALYRDVTMRVRSGIADGRFEDGPRMARLDVTFANRYLSALDAYRSGAPLSESWRIAFTAAERGRYVILQHLLLGVNAHINLDLGLAAIATCSPDTLPSLAHDFQEISTLLMEMFDDVQARLDKVSPWIGALDRIGHRTEKNLCGFCISEARELAWGAAERYSAMPVEEQAEKEQELDLVVSGLALPIAHPGVLARLALFAVRLREESNVRRVIDTLTMG